jgi:two-component sensor histidine kinase
VHELATNAVKYGSLSVEQGHVSARWKTSTVNGGTRRVEFVWEEEGGPAVTPPTEAGFGTSLLQRSVEHELDGEARLSYPETGFVCQFAFSV